MKRLLDSLQSSLALSPVSALGSSRGHAVLRPGVPTACTRRAARSGVARSRTILSTAPICTKIGLRGLIPDALSLY